MKLKNAPEFFLLSAVFLSFVLIGVALAQTSGSGGAPSGGASGGAGGGTGVSAVSSGIIHFGGRAVGYPCCNGWMFRLDNPVHGEEGDYFVWGFGPPFLHKNYLPTANNWVLGNAVEVESTCYIFLPPYCYCDCEGDDSDFTVITPGMGTS